jgi:hypothetical protein
LPPSVSGWQLAGAAVVGGGGGGTVVGGGGGAVVVVVGGSVVVVGAGRACAAVVGVTERPQALLSATKLACFGTRMGLAPERSAYVEPLLTTKMVDPVGHGWVTFREDELHAVIPAFVIFLWPVATFVHLAV